MTSKLRGQRAFTLLEVMFAGTILSIGAASFLSSYYTLMHVAEHQRRLAQAIHVTQGKLEELLVADATALTSGFADLDPLGRVTDNPTSVTFIVNWTVIDDQPRPGFMHLQVKTSWAETTGLRSTAIERFRKK